MKWSEVKWSEVKSSQVEWSEVEWSEVKWSEVKWSQVKWSEVKWSEVKWSEVKSIALSDLPRYRGWNWFSTLHCTIRPSSVLLLLLLLPLLLPKGIVACLSSRRKSLRLARMVLFIYKGSVCDGRVIPSFNAAASRSSCVTVRSSLKYGQLEDLCRPSLILLNTNKCCTT